jgi:diguanylate cyclase (GGDEF)-like protein
MAEVLLPKQADIQRRILRERLRLVYEQTPRSIPLTLVAVTVMAFLGSRNIPPWAVALWWFGMAGLALLRYGAVLSFRRTKGDDETQRYWSRISFYIVLAAGIGWGLGSVLLAYEATIEYQLLLLLILAGIAGGALPFLSVHLPSFIGFILAITVPNVTWLLWQGGRIEVISGMLLTVYMAALLYNAHRVSILMNETLNLRFQNEAMAQSLMHEKDELQELNRELERLSHIDGLTQLANRRYFDARFQEQWQRGIREHASIAVLMLDIDEFKKYNDAYGHTAGDTCLQRVANAINVTLMRPSDLAARYGGEEFVVLLANTRMDGAINVADEILRRISDLNISHETSSVADTVTISIGVSAVVPDRDIPRAYLIEAADLALYKSKHAGRNRITTQSIDEQSYPRLLGTDDAC